MQLKQNGITKKIMIHMSICLIISKYFHQFSYSCSVVDVKSVYLDLGDFSHFLTMQFSTFCLLVILFALNIIIIHIRPSRGITGSKIKHHFHTMDTRHLIDSLPSRGFKMKSFDNIPIQPNEVFDPFLLRNALQNEDGKDCKDDHPYCERFVYTYGTDTPFTLCDEEWFISKQGFYGCRLSCKLC